MGWCNMYPRLKQQKGGAFVYSAETWKDLVAVETGENKIQKNDDVICVAVMLLILSSLLRLSLQLQTQVFKIDLMKCVEGIKELYLQCFQYRR